MESPSTQPPIACGTANLAACNGAVGRGVINDAMVVAAMEGDDGVAAVATVRAWVVMLLVSGEALLTRKVAARWGRGRGVAKMMSWARLVEWFMVVDSGVILTVQLSPLMEWPAHTSQQARHITLTTNQPYTSDQSGCVRWQGMLGGSRWWSG